MPICFPISCLKVFIGIGSVLTIFMAAGMLTATIYANVQKGKIIDKGNLDLANGVLAGLYVVSILFLVMGLGGLYGSFKKNKCLLAIFAVGTSLFLLVFIAGTFLFFLAPKAIFDGNCIESKTSWITDLAKMNIAAQSIFCQTCACNFTNIDNTYTPEEAAFLTNTNILSPANNVLACPEFKALNFSDTDTILMSALESQLDCGGWCGNTPFSLFYYFTTVTTTNKPKEACYDAFKGFFEKNGLILGLGCSAALAFCVLNMIMICCLCFHPSKTGNRSDFYKRMVEDD